MRKYSIQNVLKATSFRVMFHRQGYQAIISEIKTNLVPYTSDFLLL